jgi:hypothetical protein
MDRQALHSEILQDLKARNTWETRQRTWYQMRHDGLRRRYKPWPNASDLHFPLIDTAIEKLKPYYAEQLWATDTIATFVAKRSQSTNLTTGAAQWFDYKIKQCSNLEDAAVTWIDHMLTSGRAVMKVRWDTKKRCVCFDPISPLNIIVPRWTKDIESAERIVHVIQISKEAYKLQENYRQEPDFVESICGKGNSKENDTAQAELEKELREGLTGSESPDQIILWEVHYKVGGKWMVETFSPLNPTKAVKDRTATPYNHGLPPFVDAIAERKDEGWYSPRGIAEKLAPFEASLCRLWNEKHDFMTLVNRPLFKNEGTRNTANFQMVPGQILPEGIEPVILQQPPVSFDQEMTSTRQVAEQRVAMPDFGMNQVMNTRDRRTATEIQSINGVMSNAIDLRARIFRRALGRLYRMAWSLYCEFERESLQYFFQENLLELPKDALHEEYHIMPTGSADGVNKAYLMQKAISRFQMFAGNPFIDQRNLVTSVLEADDPTLARRLLTSPEQVSADQMEEQAYEITVLRDGWPASIKPTDDHAAHIQVLMGYLNKQAQTGQPFDPVAKQRIDEHLMQHLQALQQADPKKFKELQAAMAGGAQ